MLEKRSYACQAHANFCISVALINEARFSESEYDADLMARKASGFLALAETVDYFKDYLRPDDLEKSRQIAKKAIEVSSRTVQDYAETELERSRLETQIRAASYLIIESIQHYSQKHTKGNEVHASSLQNHAVQSREADCEAFIAAFADVLTPEEARSS